MTPTDINRRLALAIGYAPKDVQFSLENNLFVWHVGSWREFDHQDWHTIGPIMERYKIVPAAGMVRGEWYFAGRGFNLSDQCLRTCAALAVIEAHERGLLL